MYLVDVTAMGQMRSDRATWRTVESEAALKSSSTAGGQRRAVSPVRGAHAAALRHPGGVLPEERSGHERGATGGKFGERKHWRIVWPITKREKH